MINTLFAWTNRLNVSVPVKYCKRMIVFQHPSLIVGVGGSRLNVELVSYLNYFLQAPPPSVFESIPLLLNAFAHQRKKSSTISYLNRANHEFIFRKFDEILPSKSSLLMP